MWSKQEPHKHNITVLNNHNNYCRNPKDNPDNTQGAWCYTTDKNKRWEKCNIPICRKNCDRGIFCPSSREGPLKNENFHT